MTKIINEVSIIIFFVSIIFLKLCYSYEQEQEMSLNFSTQTYRIISLKNAIEIAEQNYKPLQLAKKEIEVAKLKLLEASRNFYPNIIFKAEQTNGESIENLGTPDFREQNIGFQLNYTLYEGSKITNLYKQAKSNYKIAQYKFNKIRSEMLFSINEAYWNLLRIKRNLDDYEDALVEARKYYDMAKKLYDNNMLSFKDLLAAQAQLNQISYHIDSLKPEEENYLWKLAVALGLNTTPKYFVVSDIPYKDVEAKLEDCVYELNKSNPDILIQREIVEASRIAYNIKSSYLYPKIELTGFYGKSGGAYKSEDLKLSEDYNIMLKLTQIFLNNSISLSGFDQKTSPKLGQSSRTASKTTNATLGILDSVKNYVELKETDLNFEQAIYNLEKVKIDSENALREAFYNYRKALVQVKNSAVDLNLAEKEYQVGKLNLADEKISIPNFIEVISRLVSAKASVREARTYYLLAIASINKAVGVYDKYNIPE